MTLDGGNVVAVPPWSIGGGSDNWQTGGCKPGRRPRDLHVWRIGRVVVRQPDARLDLLHGRKCLRPMWRGAHRQPSTCIPLHRSDHRHRAGRIQQQSDCAPDTGSDLCSGCPLTLPLQIVEGREIEIHLASMLGLKSANLKIHGDQAAEAPMIEQEIDVTIPVLRPRRRY